MPVPRRARVRPPTPPTTAENHGDSSGKLWSMYVTEAEKEDEQITKKWLDDTGGILVFNGLLSAIVVTFLTLSLPKLTPDSESGVQTVALLTQLVNISTGAPVVVQNRSTFQPPVSIVRVNAMWILSLMISLYYALLTTSMQQSARVYLDYTQHCDAPRKQARIREYKFEGIEEFRLSQAVGTMPFLLHTSVFLFFAGLIDFLLPINKVVAFSAVGLVVYCTFVYAVFTLLPFLRPNCPYRTPLSGFAYFSFHFNASAFFWAAMLIVDTFHELLPEDGQRSLYDRLIWWRGMLEEKLRSHSEHGRIPNSSRMAYSRESRSAPWQHHQV